MAFRSRLAWQSSQPVRTRSRSWRRAADEYGMASFGDGLENDEKIDGCIVIGPFQNRRLATM
jgi:hypothetical protein